ncbi:MAG: glycosyltransferase family 4 protein [Opitutales bacterium]
MKKILIIVENLPVPFDRRVWLEARTLKQAGHQVSVICPTGKGFRALFEEREGIYIYRHPLPPERSSHVGYFTEYSSALWAEWTLARRVMRERGFDVIQACNPPDLIFIVALWFKLFHRTAFIFDHHDLSPELYESKFRKKGFFYQLLKITERLTFATADIVISTNESYKEVAIRRGKKKPNNVHVVRSGPDLSFFNRVPGNAAHRKGKKYMIGYLGVMGEFDGVDHLVRAAHELIANRQRTDIHFCLIGSGPMFETLKKQSKELGIDEYVEFAGRLSDKEMIERLSSCDIGVTPDPKNPLNEKSTMNKILEYMALQLPIVQYDLLEGKRSAEGASLYALPNDHADFATKIESLLNDPERRSEMGKLGRKRMQEKLEWRHQVSKLLFAYAQVLEKKNYLEHPVHETGTPCKIEKTPHFPP